MKHPAISVAIFLTLATCTAPVKPLPSVPASAAAWTIAGAVPDLVAASCLPADGEQEPAAEQLTVTRVDIGTAEALKKRLAPGVTVAGAWQLSSTNANFGGLSDLRILADGRMLAVSDTGAFIWLGRTDGVPDGAMHLSYMLGSDGQQLNGKIESDAEGLAVDGHVAFVSFERDHRVSAFAIGACGAMAREVRVASLPHETPAGKVDENLGAEALALTPASELVFGYELTGGGVSPLGRVNDDGTAAWTGEKAPNPGGYALVSTDFSMRPNQVPTQFWLFRSYDPIRGARIILRWQADAVTNDISIQSPLLSDNFEGVTSEDMGNGIVRVWIVSDDNFSASQRTLLYAFDIALPTE